MYTLSEKYTLLREFRNFVGNNMIVEIFSLIKMLVIYLFIG